MSGKDIKFQCHSFDNVHPNNKNDVVYLDPPYSNTKSSLYMGDIDFELFCSWINKLECSWFLNFNGKHGINCDCENLPIDGYQMECLNSGNSSFNRLKNENVNVGNIFIGG